jgi:hypothetical protein
VPVAGRTVYSRGKGRADDGLARWRGAGALDLDGITECFSCAGGWRRELGATASGCPFSCFWALMCGLCSVIEAECAFARFAAEREEVELVAVAELAVFSYQSCVSNIIHCGVTLWWLGGSR